tara:strand:+ start:93 stop:587 length:495 start_codon:yes stop_codon:yes gene_type:complete
MFGIFSGVKMALIGGVVAVAVGGYIYVNGLQKDLAVAKENNVKLEQSVESQKAVIEQMQRDFELQREINLKLDTQVKTLQKEYASLDDRFNKINSSGKKRDIGALAVDKSKAIERIINKGTANAQRCVEIAMGSPLTEKEKNATKKSEINPECPSIANPSYVPY